MLRTIFGIIFLSIFVTPVFAAPTPLTPQMLSQEKIYELYDTYEVAEGVVEHKRDDGSIILFIVARGSSTNDALCHLVGYLKEYAEENSADINSKIKSALPKGMHISSNSILRDKSVNQLERIIETQESITVTEINMNNAFLNCTKTEKIIEMTNPVTGKTVGEVTEKNIIEINTDSSGSIISITDFQGDRIKIMEYGVLAAETEVAVIIVMGIKL